TAVVIRLDQRRIPSRRVGRSWNVKWVASLFKRLKRTAWPTSPGTRMNSAADPSSSSVNDGPEPNEQHDAAERAQDGSQERHPSAVRSREPASPERHDRTLEKDESDTHQSQEVVVERRDRPPREDRRVGNTP